ncbi:Uma2 family endonuclease [Longimicrobium terrae]|uniref:Uma2 family endonuclease n=1 Tax=Longimicrobium terrae TaxID=1639882 RepID=A0A841GZK4_9BACT|nr:Uma2 family endonuclease [Longimicrobium terrae]MBB4636770.1 Uma2 family endonuclease [Longimicrobium terrae]MBB6071231.1 Uma2 family endonuclease [Longimicrobium terrae]NNC29277.1 Uma2 family endonuclease [Longimicrobium terrae]
MKTAPPDREATLEDLEQVEGKAELVDGRLVLVSPAGDLHGTAALNVATSLKLYQRDHGGGRAYGDNVGFVLRPRTAYAPDASWYVGPRSGARILEGAPVLAVEVRSPDDYGLRAEQRLSAKRAEYFAAGTLVVWDVDVVRDHRVRVYRSAQPFEPAVLGRGETADAEPAVPGWRFPVDELFE